MNKTIFLLLIGTALVSTMACKRTLPDNGTTAVVKMANNWWVTATGSLSGQLTTTHVFFATYNAASNTNDSLWVDDLGGIVGIKTETSANYGALTFSSSNSVNLYDTVPVSVFNGKVFPLGGLSKTGVKTDSLYLQALLSDRPGDTITISGTARTGFDEDEY
jgi:hypothetical protein